MLKKDLAFGGILAILSGVGIYNNIYAATGGTTKFSVDINNAVLELTIPSSPAVIDLNPTMTNASFGSTSINVHVATNNITGYTLTMTPTNNQEATSLIRTELIEDEEEYREIETLEQTDPISTGYTEQTFTTNKWGYKITGDNYYGIDPENTTVSHPAWATSAPTNGTNHNLTLAAKVDADTVSGAYETTLNFHAVTNAVPLVSLEMSYGFHGKQKVTVNNEEYYKMQDMTTEICSYTNEIPSQLEVVDIRDNTIYHIAKLQDGRCWLQDNLALDLTDPTVQANMDSSNTNADATALNALFNGGRVSGDSATNNLATSGITTWTSGYSFSVPMIYTAIKNNTYSSDPIEEIRSSSFGIYYNYCAVTAGSYCYGNSTSGGTSYDRPNTLIDAEYDICPAGWRLPTSTSDGEYQTIYNSYAATDNASQVDNFRSALLLPLSGYFHFSHGQAKLQEQYSSWWSSTRNSDKNVFYLDVSTARVIPSQNDERWYGITTRCIAK